ncbi:MAG: hypothetical protein V7700_01730 [Halioglobus sp.]
MKTLTTLALTLALSSGAFTVHAADQSEQDVATCMAELQAYYGDATELILVERRRNQHGTRMKVAAKRDTDNSYFANCWVAKNEFPDFADESSQNMIAVASPVISAQE